MNGYLTLSVVGTVTIPMVIPIIASISTKTRIQIRNARHPIIMKIIGTRLERRHITGDLLATNNDIGLVVVSGVRHQARKALGEGRPNAARGDLGKVPRTNSEIKPGIADGSCFS